MDLRLSSTESICECKLDLDIRSDENTSEADGYGGMLRLHLAEQAMEWWKILGSSQLIDGPWSLTPRH
jgi:hypothetical protein